jgi:hypothetical protein
VDFVRAILILATLNSSAHVAGFHFECVFKVPR